MVRFVFILQTILTDLMKKYIALLLVVLSSTMTTRAQDYFQQEVNYTIDVKLDDVNHMLRGFETFEYINNSPDTLYQLFIHLWPNAYKNEKTALAKQLARDGNYFLYYSKNKDRGFIDSLQFKVDGLDVTFEYFQNFEDIARIALSKPIPPKGKAMVSTPFRVKIPSGTISRLGHIGESYQITQWYPKPAVYDKNGWNPIPYLTQGEFYSEFGSFDVKITLPENYTVGSTGDLQTASEKERLEALAIAPAINDNNAFPPSADRWKTLQYTQKHVHDFGWFADKRWIVRKGEVSLPNSNRKVTTWAMFTPTSASLWEGNAIKAINDALYNYSLWVGEYPYEHCTAVDGTISAGGGMEYPNVTVIGSSSNKFQLETVIIHEVGHNWFYGILGSNEREHGWMDEGINSFMETLTLEWMYGNPKLYEGMLEDNIGKALKLDRYPLNYQNELMYGVFARMGKDQPIQTSSEDFTGSNYGAIMYKKTGLAFNYLRNYLGDELFKKCMHDYYNAWKFKHPSPKDIRYSFEKSSGKNLDWFFEGVINTTGVVDYKTESSKFKGDSLEITVFNAGDIRAPFSISLYRDSVEYKKEWVDGFSSGSWSKYSFSGAQKGDVVKLNTDAGSLDIDRGNNNIRTKGILKTREPLRVSLLTGIDNPEETRLFWIPMVGWNNHDKWMPGVSIHNRTFPVRKFEFAWTPMYSIANNRLNGFAMAQLNGRRFTVGMSSKAFSLNDFSYRLSPAEGQEERYLRAYQQVNPYFEWRAPVTTSVNPTKVSVRLDGFAIRQLTVAVDDHENRFNDPNDLLGASATVNVSKRFIGGQITAAPQVDYIATEFENGLVSRIRVDADYTYWKRRKKKMYLKLFGATSEWGGNRFNAPLGASGTDGSADYFYRNLYLGRATDTGILGRQIVDNQGGFYHPNPSNFNGQFTSITTAQFEMDLPISLPISVYGTMASDLENDPVFTAGVGLPIVRNVFQIYLPLVYSDSISNGLKGLEWHEYIMFQLNLDLINPFSLINKIN